MPHTKQNKAFTISLHSPFGLGQRQILLFEAEEKTRRKTKLRLRNKFLSVEYGQV